MSSARFRANIGPAQDAGRRAAERGLGKALEHGLGESRKEVPLEEGTLMRSGAVAQDGLEGAVYYDTVYARRQHEELTWRHDPGRKAKYLEDPWEREGPTMSAIIAAEVRREIGG